MGNRPGPKPSKTLFYPRGSQGVSLFKYVLPKVLVELFQLRGKRGVLTSGAKNAPRCSLQTF